MMQTLILVLITLLIAFTGVMIAIMRIESEEDRRMGMDDAGNQQSSTETEDDADDDTE